MDRPDISIYGNQASNTPPYAPPLSLGQETSNFDETWAKILENNNALMIQLQQQAQATQIMLQQLLKPLQSPQPSSTNQGQQDMNTDKIKPRDIGYFDPDEKKPPVETSGNKTLYHDVFSFTKRVRVLKNTHGELIAQILNRCLLNKAELWYTDSLTRTTRATLHKDVNKWCEMLEERFRESPGIALNKLENLRYMIADVQAQKDPEQYVQQIVSLAKNARKSTSDQDIISIAYYHMQLQLRKSLQRPDKYSDLEDFLKDVRAVREDWYEEYQPRERSTSIEPFSPSEPRSQELHYQTYEKQSIRLNTPLVASSAQQPRRSARTSSLERPEQQHNRLDHRYPSNRRPFNAFRRDYRLYSANNNDEYTNEQSSEDEAVQDNQHSKREAELVQFINAVKEAPAKPIANTPVAKITFTPSTASKAGSQCSVCKQSFSSNNKLHKHLKSDNCTGKNEAINIHVVPQGTGYSPAANQSPIRSEPIIVTSTAEPSTSEPGYAFKGYGFAYAMTPEGWIIDCDASEIILKDNKSLKMGMDVVKSPTSTPTAIADSTNSPSVNMDAVKSPTSIPTATANSANSPLIMVHPLLSTSSMTTESLPKVTLPEPSPTPPPIPEMKPSVPTIDLKMSQISLGGSRADCQDTRRQARCIRSRTSRMRPSKRALS